MRRCEPRVERHPARAPTKRGPCHPHRRPCRPLGDPTPTVGAASPDRRQQRLQHGTSWGAGVRTPERLPSSQRGKRGTVTPGRPKGDPSSPGLLRNLPAPYEGWRCPRAWLPWEALGTAVGTQQGQQEARPCHQAEGRPALGSPRRLQPPLPGLHQGWGWGWREPSSRGPGTSSHLAAPRQAAPEPGARRSSGASSGGAGQDAAAQLLVGTLGTRMPWGAAPWHREEEPAPQGAVSGRASRDGRRRAAHRGDEARIRLASSDPPQRREPPHPGQRPGLRHRPHPADPAPPQDDSRTASGVRRVTKQGGQGTSQQNPDLSWSLAPFTPSTRLGDAAPVSLSALGPEHGQRRLPSRLSADQVPPCWPPRAEPP